MTFQNNKKTFLEKLDKSKKGEIDEKVIPLINLINSKDNCFTTSSCSGRVVLWTGTGKKDETEWLNVSHSQINEGFFDGLENNKELVWLRLEPFILHVCCSDLESARQLLNQSQQIYKKSSLLSINNKIIVEIKGSEFMELPLVKDGKFLFNKLDFLTETINQKLTQIHQRIDLFYNKLKEKEKKEINPISSPESLLIRRLR